MKKFILLAAAACSFASPAFAEDDDWTGAYIGVSGGYTGAKSDSTVALSNSWTVETQALRDLVTNGWAAKQKVDNGNFGGQIGYNFQTGGAVLGLEGDVTILPGKNDISRTLTYSPTLNYLATNRIDPKSFFSLRAKAGVATGKTLIYVHGGWGWTRASVAAELTGNNGYHKLAQFDKTFNGYIVGAGVEHKFTHNMSLRLEYAYTDQGDVTYDVPYVTGSSFAPPAFNYTETFTQDLRMHLVRVGLNVHF